MEDNSGSQLKKQNEVVDLNPPIPKPKPKTEDIGRPRNALKALELQ